jgi:hypothetical protein
MQYEMPRFHVLLHSYNVETDSIEVVVLSSYHDRFILYRSNVLFLNNPSFLSGIVVTYCFWPWISTIYISTICTFHGTTLLISFVPTFWPEPCMLSSSVPLCYIPCLSYPPLPDHSNYIRWRVQVAKPWICISLQPPATSFLFGPHILLSTLFPNTVNLFFSLDVRSKVPLKIRTLINNPCSYFYFCLFLIYFIALNDRRIRD